MIKDPASLEYQTAIIPLRQGVDLKTATQVVDPPAMLALSNVTMHAPGEIAKDRGYAFLPTTDLAGVAMPAQFRRFIEHSSAQLIVGRDNLAERSETVDAFHVPANRTAIASSSAERLISLDANTPPGACDMSTSGAYDMIAAIYGANLRVTVRERATGTIMSTLASAVGLGLGTAPRCFAVNTTLICVWADGANLRATRWDSTTAGTPLSAPANIAVNVNAATKHVDAVGSDISGLGYIAYTTTVPTVVVQRITPALGLSGAAAGVAGTVTEGLAVALDSAQNQLVAWTGAPGLSMFGLTPIGVARGNSVVSAVAHSCPCVISNENATGRGTIFAPTTGGAGDTDRYQVAFTGAGGALATATLFGWRLAHKPVLIDALIFMGYRPHVAFNADTQLQYVLATVVHRADNGAVSTADPVAWYLYDTAQILGTFPTPFFHPASMNLVAGAYRWLAPLRKLPRTSTNTADGLSVLELRPYDGQAAPLRRMPVVCNAIANGQYGFFDASFGHAPSIGTPSQQNVAGGLNPGDTYTYTAYFELLLPDGTLVRSLTTTPVPVLITGLNDQVTLPIMTPLFREGLVCNIRVARTLANGSVFHLLPAKTPADTRTAGAVNVVDQLPDASLASEQLLYTSGGVLDAYPAPMSRALVLHQGRVFGIDENSNQLRYTREVLDGEAPAWHPTLSIDCTGTNMDPRALITSPSGLWVLGRDRQTGNGAIALLLGTGPADNGEGSTYELQRLENCDVGPAEYRHAVSTPLGILFVDPAQGFHLLPTGGGAPVFVGAPIEPRRAIVVAMHVLRDRKVVRVTQTNGITSLDWHYDQNQWSTRGQQPVGVTVLDATMWDGRHVLLASFAMARQENGFFGDPLAGYQVTTFTTAWIKSAGFDGLQRIWRLYLLGRNIAPHGLTVTLQYDYNDTAPGDVFTFTEAEVAAAVASGKYEFRVSPRKQLCESFRVTVADTAGSTGNGQGAAWVALRLEYGALRASSRKASFARKS